jgi:tripartite motif-containing protein 2/3
LLDDCIRVRALERRALRHGSVFCTACTSGDRAVGHCSSCTSYLCAQCCQAHQYMKCFEQHRVRLLTDLLNNDELFDETTNSGPKCSQHNRCEIRFFCTTCSIPLCGECLPNHPQNEHDVHPSQLEQIRGDLNDKLERLGEMREVALTRIDNQLTHLQRDYDLAKTQIDLAHLAYQQTLSKVYVSERNTHDEHFLYKQNQGL